MYVPTPSLESILKNFLPCPRRWFQWVFLSPSCPPGGKQMRLMMGRTQNFILRYKPVLHNSITFYLDDEEKVTEKFTYNFNGSDDSTKRQLIGITTFKPIL